MRDPDTGEEIGASQQASDPYADDLVLQGIDKRIAELQKKQAGGENQFGFLNLRSIQTNLDALQRKRDDRIAELDAKKPKGAQPAQVRKFKSEAEVEAANLPDGTVVDINGKQYRWTK
jgi:hypothetical protein